MDLYILRSVTKIDFQAEYRFCERRWRFDFAEPNVKLAIEIEGGVWIKGRHIRGSGFIKDIEKYNKAIELGWTILRYTPQQLNKTETYSQIKNIYNNLKNNNYTKKINNYT